MNYPSKFLKWLKFLKKALLVISAIYGFIFFFLINDLQRANFGARTATILLIIEIGIPILIYLGYHLRKQGKKCEVIAGAWLLVSILFLFSGWLIHPNQIHERALDRLFDWESARADLKESLRETKSMKDASLYLRRFQEELSARKLEYQAAEIRYKGEPKYFHSTFFTWSLWFFAMVCFVSAATSLFDILKEVNHGTKIGKAKIVNQP